MPSRKSSNVWDQVVELVGEGQRPVITLPEARRVIVPKRPNGRPRVRDLNKPFNHYVLHTPRGQRLRCRARGCTKWLKKDDSIACSPHCKQELIDEARMILDVLEERKPREEFPVSMRDYRAKKVG